MNRKPLRSKLEYKEGLPVLNNRSVMAIVIRP
jgi:hypothetical protein